MKNLLIAAGAMVGVIGMRMILSLTVSEQAAEVFCRTALGILFFYYAIRIGVNRRKRKNVAAAKTA